MTTFVVVTVVILVVAALLVAGGALDRPRPGGGRRERLVRPRSRVVERPARRVVVEEEVPVREVVREERRIID